MRENIKSFSSQVKSLISSSPNNLYILFLIIGIILVFGGLYLKNKNSSSSNIEVLDTPSTSIKSAVTSSGKIVVDISGGVESPGVYHLSSDDRIEDLLVASGGLSANADRNWVDKNLNRAAKLSDGQKLYIPLIQQSNVLGASISKENTNVAQSNSTSDSNLININTASLNELDALPGIGQVYAQKIVDQRPYSDLNELTSKKVISQSVFNKIKDKISLY